MNYSTAIFLINKNVRAVLCNYEPDSPDKRHLLVALAVALTLLACGAFWLLWTGE